MINRRVLSRSDVIQHGTIVALYDNSVTVRWFDNGRFDRDETYNIEDIPKAFTVLDESINKRVDNAQDKIDDLLFYFERHGVAILRNNVRALEAAEILAEYLSRN